MPKQLITTLTGFFGPSSSEKQKPRKEANPEGSGSFSIPYIAFTKGFLLFNPDLYTIRQDVPVSDATIESLADTHASAGSTVAEHLRDPATSSININELFKANGSFCIGIEYINDGIEWHSVILGQFNESSGLVIHDIVTGFIGNGPNLPFCFQEAFCLHSTSAEGHIFATPADKTGFKNALCHADHSFLQILSGAQPYTEPKQKWIEAQEQHEDAKRALRRLQSRTLETATNDANMIMWQDLNFKIDTITRTATVAHPARKPV